jgi:hypothetical protein
MKNRIKQFVLDGEAVVLGLDGISDFNALHWARAQSDKPKLSDAIRRLVELGLKVKQPKG